MDLHFVPGDITQNSLQKMALRCGPAYLFIFFSMLETGHPQDPESLSWYKITDVAASPIDVLLVTCRALSKLDYLTGDYPGLYQPGMPHFFFPTFRVSFPIRCFLSGIIACLNRRLNSWHYYFWCNNNDHVSLCIKILLLYEES
jgi:hypothetical protein